MTETKGLDYGYRSKCHYAPIRLGRRKIKGTNKQINIWVCTQCKKRDVDIVEYNKDATVGSSQKLPISSSFIPDEDNDDI